MKRSNQSESFPDSRDLRSIVKSLCYVMLGLAFCLTRSSLKYWAEGSTWWGEVEWERMGEIEGGKSVEMSRVSWHWMQRFFISIYLSSPFLFTMALNISSALWGSIEGLGVDWESSECENASASFRSLSVLHFFCCKHQAKCKYFSDDLLLLQKALRWR